jgi:hypothetical protein
MPSNRFAVAAVLIALAVLPMASGCVQERHEVVPASATLGAEGKGMLNYSTAGPGSIWVSDETDNRLLYSGDVSGERQITVDPEKREILVDGQVVTDKTITRGHNHKIFFLPRYR